MSLNMARPVLRIFMIGIRYGSLYAPNFLARILLIYKYPLRDKIINMLFYKIYDMRGEKVDRVKGS
jgi:hypothetical protein